MMQPCSGQGLALVIFVASPSQLSSVPAAGCSMPVPAPHDQAAALFAAGLSCCLQAPPCTWQAPLDSCCQKPSASGWKSLALLALHGSAAALQPSWTCGTTAATSPPALAECISSACSPVQAWHDSCCTAAVSTCSTSSATAPLSHG